MKYHLLLPTFAALALAACSGGNESATAEGDAAATGTETEMADPAAATPAAGAMATTAQAFVDQAGASDLFEIESGKLAQEMGKSQGVKDFGAMLVKDHTKSSSDIKAAAANAQGVIVAPKLTAKQQSDLDALRSAGDSFDTTFRQQQVAAHEQALALHQGYSRNGDNDALKAVAAKVVPVVQAHLTQVRGM